MIHFCNVSRGLISRGKEATQPHLCCLRVKGIALWPITSRLKKQWGDQSWSWSTCVIMYLWTEELAGKFLFYAITHNTSWWLKSELCCWGIGVIYLNCGKWNLGTLESYRENCPSVQQRKEIGEEKHKALRGRRLLYKGKDSPEWYNGERSLGTGPVITEISAPPLPFLRGKAGKPRGWWWQGKLEASATWYKELKEENKRPLENTTEAERGAGQEKHANRFRQPDVAICITINSDVSRWMKAGPDRGLVPSMKLEAMVLSPSAGASYIFTKVQSNRLSSWERNWKIQGPGSMTIFSTSSLLISPSTELERFFIWTSPSSSHTIYLVGQFLAS